MRVAEVVDLGLAERLILSYRRGVMQRDVLRRRLSDIGGIPAQLVEPVIAEAEATPLDRLEWRVGRPRQVAVAIPLDDCHRCDGSGTVTTVFGCERRCPSCEGRGLVAAL